MGLDIFSQGAIPISKEEKITSKRGWPLQVLERINNNAYKIDLSREVSVYSTLNVADLNSFYIGDDFFYLRTKPFENGEDDKDHGVPNIPIEPITRSKTKKIQQAFILYLQNWVGSVQPSFYVLQADSIEEWPFVAPQVNICTVEAADEVASII